MTQRPKLRKMLAKNPAVNKRQLREVLRVLDDLRRAGIEESGYNIAPPFTRRFQRRNVAEGPPPGTRKRKR